MKLSKTVQNIWILLGSYSLGGAIAVVIALLGYSWQVGAIVFVVWLLGLWIGLWWIKRLMVTTLPQSWMAQTVCLSDDLRVQGDRDLSWLAEQSEALERLGFLHLEDYKLNNTPHFGRSFAHPDQHCFAEIGQLFRANLLSANHKPRGTYTILFTPMERGWMLVDIARKAQREDSMAYLLCHPREVRRYHEKIAITDLLERHVQFRSQMLEDLQTEIIPQLNWEIYREIQQELALRPRRTFQRQNLLLALWKLTQFERNPHDRWLGEYGRWLQDRKDLGLTH
jgi:hypothetical protein